jgi:uncharacterized protein YyaL (SSP411 family)
VAHTNRLADETSPYLLQHQHNPIDWFPWGKEAIERAREEDKPIFLSVGYSACHWCHVMERESFEDEHVAAFLNEHFVSIKVDREERPDIDAIYMDAVQLMTGSGGWPMSVWLDHDLRPFYAGMYFPPESRYGRPGFMMILRELERIWREDRERVAEVGESINERLALMAAPREPDADNPYPLSLDPLGRILGWLANQFDARHGGFGDAPKFPQPAQLATLFSNLTRPSLEASARQGAMSLAEKTLVHMACGGMYDHLGGGFHRYSVDERWLIPHFEKMLYDNAQLMSAYTEAFAYSGRPFYARVVREIATYLEREMLEPYSAHARPFWSTQDADSEGEEGKFFVWTPEQLAEVLGEEDGARAATYWGVTEDGNFEHGTSALNRLHVVEGQPLANAFEPLDEEVARWREALFEARSERIAPGTDTKVITAWNGLMIEALANASVTFGEPKYLALASDAARFFVEQMIIEDEDGIPRLMRIYREGAFKFSGYLEDHAFLLAGLLALFEASGEPSWLDHARRICDMMLEAFADRDGLFFATGVHHEDLIVRQKPIHDGATPSGNGVALRALGRLSALTHDDDLRARVERGLVAMNEGMTKHPHAFPVSLLALSAHLRGFLQLVVVYPDGEDEDDALLLAAREVPSERVIRIFTSESRAKVLAEHLPWLEGKSCQDDAPTAYLCREGACQLPVTDAVALREQLDRALQEER